MNSALLLLGFAFGIFAAVKPFKLGRVPVNMATGGLISVLLLLAFGVLDTGTILQGVMGKGSLQPWEIVVIFFTVAYVSISVDITGIFDFLAHKIVRAAKGNGSLLFLFFYVFAGVLTIFTSNDIVILTLTPIIFYLGRHAKINIVPLLFAEFFAANTLSMFLYIGNPTNIIVGNALDLGFWEYTRVMWVPTLVAALANYGFLRVIFNQEISREYKLNKTSDFAVRNWNDAMISCVLMLGMLVCLAFSQQWGIPIWKVTTAAALTFILEDILFGLYYHWRELKQSQAQTEKGKDVYSIPEDKNEFFMALRRIPWKVLPFVLSFFVMVEALNGTGLITRMGAWMTHFSPTSIGGIFSMGTAGLLLANVINNQPMTILLTNVLLNDAYTVSEAVHNASAYALIIASNLGANLTLMGALAGLMWHKILKTKGMNIRGIEFLEKGILITPVVFVLSLLSLYLVLL